MQAQHFRHQVDIDGIVIHKQNFHCEFVTQK
jgi:hypothetical protein